jgi:hypothetical protein
VRSKISITFDAYTSRAADPYLAITAHYIDVPSDSPSCWKLASDVLAFEHVPGSHTGTNLAAIIEGVVDRFGFRSKVCTNDVWRKERHSHLSLPFFLPSTRHLVWLGNSRQCIGQ